MRDREYKFTVTNTKSGKQDFEFEGTELAFVQLYTSNMDSITDVGYPDSIISEYRRINDGVEELNERIERLKSFDKDSVVFVNNDYSPALISNSYHDIDNDFSIKAKPLKHDSVFAIESLGYSIHAVNGKDYVNKLYLIEDGQKVAHTTFPSNGKQIDSYRARIAGLVDVKEFTGFANALDRLYAISIAHSMANDRIEPAKLTGLVENLPKHLRSEYERTLDKMGGRVESVAIPEAQHFYLIHAKQFSRGEPVLFTNEFVGTERAFKEYLEDYKPQVLKIELFQPEFVKPHREIEKIIIAYKNNTGNKEHMLETVKGFDEKALLRLEDRLKDEGIDKKKFSDDLNKKQAVKMKI